MHIWVHEWRNACRILFRCIVTKQQRGDRTNKFRSTGATGLLLYWKIDAGDSVSGQEGGVGPIELSLIIVPDILPVS
jgi:hypothetical protein